MDLPAPMDKEQSAICSARTSRERCLCGELHADGITPTVVARMKAYLAANPGQQFAFDDEAGILAVVIAPDPGDSGPPEIIGWARDLIELLDTIGAPSVAGLS